MKTIAITLLAIAVVAGVFALVPSKEAQSRVAATHQPAPTPSVGGDAEEPALTIAVDDTISMESSVRKSVLQNLCERLPGTIRKGHFKRVNVLHFGSNAWITQERSFLVPQSKDEPCEEAQVKDHSAIFKPARDLAKKRAERKCREQQEKTSGKYRSELDEVLESIRQALNSAPSASAECTSFYDLLARIALKKRPSQTIIVSDVIETCKHTTVAIPEPPTGVDVVAIVVPSRNDIGKGRSGFESYTRSKEHLAKIAPWVRIESPNADVN